MAEIKQIDTKTLVSWINNKKEFTILDIRPQAEREEWSIPESNYFNAYNELKAGNINALDGYKFDNKKPVVTLCSRGNLSLFAAEILANKNAESYSLTGGMNAWNNAYDTKEIIFNKFKIIQIRRVAKGCLSYIIGSKNEAFVIDSSLEPSVYTAIAEKENWTIKYVSDTHIHADYVSRTLELAKETNATHLFHSKAKVSYKFTAIDDQQIVKIGDIEIKIIYTAGHTFESISFLVDNSVIFTGDTLFIDGVGRPDLKAENDEIIVKAKLLYTSLQKIISFDNTILVMPAHTSKSISIGQPIIADTIKSIKENVANLNLSEHDFIERITLNIPQTPHNYLTITEINKSGNLEGFVFADLEAGANRCGIS